jgi:hypothetical protein
MEAKLIIIENFLEIEEARKKADNLNIYDIPERVLIANDILFNINDVRLAFITEESFIKVLIVN